MLRFTPVKNQKRLNSRGSRDALVKNAELRLLGLLSFSRLALSILDGLLHFRAFRYLFGN